MKNLKVLTLCDDNSCCCLSPRGTAVLIAVISLLACLFDALSDDCKEASHGDVREHLATLRNLLQTLFEMANMLLLLGSIVESALLLQIYLWCVLAFIVIGFVVAIVEFCIRARDDGVLSFSTFVPEVILLFVLFRCLPLVDTYRKRIEAA